MSADALTVESLDVSFGGLRALQGVSLAVVDGSVHGLLGPNGSGKTTLLNAVCGFVRSSGRVELHGQPLAHASAHARARHGLVRTFQNPKLVQHLTVGELLRMGEHAQAVRPWWVTAALPLRDRRARLQSRAHAEEVLELLGLDAALLPAAVHELPQGVLKMVDIARALMAQPELLLLDEPSSGMSEEEIVRLRARLEELRRRGTTMLVVEHNLGLVGAVCDQVTVLNLGTKICDGPPTDVLARPDVIDAFLGTSRTSAR
jgi:ABC-type branched-subunit amino acid transport system ATPase component